jgi:cellulose synthase/poly-beta-1,6-N-acetylglucosamine synthase-like glycosyltransferase
MSAVTAPSVVLALAVAAAVYILLGYPLLVALGARGRAPEVRKDLSLRIPVSVILAVRNGGRFLRAKLESLLALEYPRELVEILVISDGSADDTDSIAREFASNGVKLVRQEWQGKAAALNNAMAQAAGKILFFTDVRQPLHPLALSHLVANFADPSVGAVSGGLRLMGAAPGEQADLDLYWRYEMWMRKRHSQIDSVFNATGCIYALRSELAAALPLDTLTDDAVLPLRAFFRGYRVVLDEEAIAYDRPVVPGGEFRRRLRTLAGLWQIHARCTELFSRANRMRLHFLSHKFSRLVLPWALLVAVFATIALPESGLRSFLLTGALALLMLSALDGLIPARFPLKRLSSPARTFLAMNVAALLAVAVFFVDPQRFWSPTHVQNAPDT